MAKKKKAGKRANGEGLLRERTNGTWEARLTIGRDEFGKPIQKSFYGKGQAEAKAKRDEYLLKVKTGEYVEPSKTTFGEWINTWLDLYVKPKVKMSTFGKYTINYRAHLKEGMGKTELQKLTTEHIQKFYNEKAKTHSSSVLAILHQLINGSLKMALRLKKIPSNPAEFTVRPTVTYKEIAPPTPEEAKKYLEAAKSDRLYIAFVLAMFCGLRRGEIIGLRWSDINLEQGVLTVRQSLGRVENYEGNTELVFSEPKTANSKREIPLPSHVLVALKQHKQFKQGLEKNRLGAGYQDNDLVVCTSLGTPLDPQKLRKKHINILTRAGLRKEITLHGLRHFFGSTLAQAGENPKNIQMLMGHADIRTTLGTYCHSSIEDKKKAVERLAAILS